MAQTIKQGDIFGRVGTGFGQGLAQQLPKEIERNRLASGLEQLGQQKDLNPWQQFTGLVKHAHEYPQVIQTGGDILRSQTQANALMKMYPKDPGSPEKPPGIPPLTGFLNYSPNQKNDVSPTLANQELNESIQQGYIPKTPAEIDQKAVESFRENPEAFQGRFENARARTVQEDLTEQTRDAARQAQTQRLNNLEKGVQNSLEQVRERANVKIPDDLYNQIENDTIQSMKPRKDGGRGLSERQATQEGLKKLDNASRAFSKIDSLGSWGITQESAKDNQRAIKNLQREMEELGQTDNMALRLISQKDFSPGLAYALSQPVSKVPELNDFLKGLKPIEPLNLEIGIVPQKYLAVPATEAISERLANFVKNHENASPLAIAYELDKKGYDGHTFLKYLVDHPKLNLRKRQGEQASTPINTMNPWNDWWFESFSGIE